MTGRVYGRKLIELAHTLVMQARQLRDLGDMETARALTRRAMAYDRLGWSYCGTAEPSEP